MIVDALTDNPVRTVAEVRHALSKNGGNLGTDRIGRVPVHPHRPVRDRSRPSGSEDKLMEVALEAGADDVISPPTVAPRCCRAPENFDAVRRR